MGDGLFIHDTLVGGRQIRVLSVIDSYTRERLTLAVDTSSKGEKVAAVLSDLKEQRDLPPRITVEGGTESLPVRWITGQTGTR